MRFGNVSENHTKRENTWNVNYVINICGAGAYDVVNRWRMAAQIRYRNKKYLQKYRDLASAVLCHLLSIARYRPHSGFVCKKTQVLKKPVVGPQKQGPKCANLVLEIITILKEPIFLIIVLAFWLVKSLKSGLERVISFVMALQMAIFATNTTWTFIKIRSCSCFVSSLNA